MVTLGYGDVVPISMFEKIYVVAITLVGCFVFGYSMNQIGEILKELGKKKNVFKQKMYSLNCYMNKRDINKFLQADVRKYFEYLDEEEEEHYEEAEKAISSLPVQLREQVMMDLFGKALRSKKIFSLNFSSQFISTLALNIKEKKYQP